MNWRFLGEPSCPLWLAVFPLHSLDIQTAPQVPAGDAAIGLPRSGDLFHLQGIGQLAFMVMLFHCHSNAEVAGRQYVLPLQREY